MSVLSSNVNVQTKGFVSAQTAKNIPYYPVGIVGGGPAGTGPLIAALQGGRLGELLNFGVGVFEGGRNLIRGSLGNFALNSDTLADTFLEVFDNDPDSYLKEFENDRSVESVRDFAGSSLPLPVAGEYLQSMGRHLRKIVDSHSVSRVWLNTNIDSATRQADGSFILSGKQNGIPFQARCSRLILATGGRQSMNDAVNLEFSGRKLLAGPLREKVLLTNRILSDKTGQIWKRYLAGKSNPKVAVIGGSHSAFSTAWTMLQEKHGMNFDTGGIRILYRSRPKLYFGSAEEAHAAGYHDFDENDICPVTRRVFRLAGLRFDGRELLMQLKGIGGRTAEPRVNLQPLDHFSGNPDRDDRLQAIFEDADLIVPAFGYRPHTIDLFDENGERISLNSDSGGPLVDDDCRVLSGDSSKQPVKNVFAIGLASGFIPSGELGGEPGFRGQTNGFWLYQNGVGKIVLEQVMNSLVPSSF